MSLSFHSPLPVTSDISITETPFIAVIESFATGGTLHSCHCYVAYSNPLTALATVATPSLPLQLHHFSFHVPPLALLIPSVMLLAVLALTSYCWGGPDIRVLFPSLVNCIIYDDILALGYKYHLVFKLYIWNDRVKWREYMLRYYSEKIEESWKSSKNKK